MGDDALRGLNFKYNFLKQMGIIKNDLDIRKQARDLGVSVWQAPSFLFLMMGVIMIVLMTIIFFVSHNQTSPEFLIVTETFVVIVIFIIGNIIITNMEKLAQINKMKSEFVSIVSHQLKTPLTGVGWDIELMLSNYKKGLSKKQIEILNKIEQSNSIMTRMVNDLLDVARIDQGDLSLRKDNINLKELAERIVEKNRELASHSDVEIVLGKIREDLEIIGDEKKMEVVLDNFISNAIKYNKKGGSVFIAVNEKSKKAIFCVKDEGIGILENEKNRLFDKFYRGSEATKVDVGGTGLGLYISKNIIEQSDGRIWYKSAKKKGSEFCFDMPVA